VTKIEDKYHAIPIEQAITKMRDATTQISKQAATPNAPIGPRPISTKEKETQMLARLELETNG
jgi:hypothetical protein